MIKYDLFDIKKNISIIEICDINSLKKINFLREFDAIFIYNKKTEIDLNNFFLLARILIDKKPQMLFTIGSYAEKIHDLFDEAIFESEYKNNMEINILTSYFNAISKEALKDIFSMIISDNVVVVIFSDMPNSHNKVDFLFNGVIDEKAINEITLKIKTLINY